MRFSLTILLTMLVVISYHPSSARMDRLVQQGRRGSKASSSDLRGPGAQSEPSLTAAMNSLSIGRSGASSQSGTHFHAENRHPMSRELSEIVEELIEKANNVAFGPSGAIVYLLEASHVISSTKNYSLKELEGIRDLICTLMVLTRTSKAFDRVLDRYSTQGKFNILPEDHLERYKDLDMELHAFEEEAKPIVEALKQKMQADGLQDQENMWNTLLLLWSTRREKV